jgi:hypothetical protein
MVKGGIKVEKVSAQQAIIALMFERKDVEVNISKDKYPMCPINRSTFFSGTSTVGWLIHPAHIYNGDWVIFD